MASGSAPPVVRNQTGTWKPIKGECDDLEAYFQNLGVGWLARKLVLAVDVQYEVRQTPTLLRQTDVTGWGRHHTDYILDGLWHPVKQVGGAERLTKVSQDDITGALSIEVQLGESGGTSVDTRRLLTRTRLEQRLSLYRDSQCVARARRVWGKVETPEEARACEEAEARARQMLALDAVAAGGVGAFAGGAVSAGKALPAGGGSQWTAAYDIPVDHSLFGVGGGAASGGSPPKRKAPAATPGGAALPPAFGVSLSGVWSVDTSISDPMGPMLTALGIPWLARSVAESLVFTTTLRHKALLPSPPSAHEDPAQGGGEEERKPSSGVLEVPEGLFAGSCSMRDASSLGVNVSHLVLDGVPRRRTGDDGKSIHICATALTPEEVYGTPPWTGGGALPPNLPPPAGEPYPPLERDALPPVSHESSAAAAAAAAAAAKAAGIMSQGVEWPAPPHCDMLRGMLLSWADARQEASPASAAADGDAEGAGEAGPDPGAGGGDGVGGDPSTEPASGAGRAGDGPTPPPPIALRTVSVLPEDKGVTVEVRQLLAGGRQLRTTTDYYKAGGELACRMTRISRCKEFNGTPPQLSLEGGGSPEVGEGGEGSGSDGEGALEAPVDPPLTPSATGLASSHASSWSVSAGSGGDGAFSGSDSEEVEGTAVNFSGTWHIDWGRSQRLSEFLKSVGVDWLARRVVNSLDVTYTIDHTPVHWMVREESKLGRFAHSMLADGRFHMVPQPNDVIAPVRCMQDRTSGDVIVETLLLSDPSNGPAVHRLVPLAREAAAAEARGDPPPPALLALLAPEGGGGGGSVASGASGPRRMARTLPAGVGPASRTAVRRPSSDFARRYGRGRADSGASTHSAVSASALAGVVGATGGAVLGGGGVPAEEGGGGAPPPGFLETLRKVDEDARSTGPTGDAASPRAPLEEEGEEGGGGHSVASGSTSHTSPAGGGSAAVWDRVSKQSARILDIRHADGRTVQRQVLMYITADGVAKHACTRYLIKVESPAERMAAEAASARALERARQRRALRRRRHAAALESMQQDSAAEGGEEGGGVAPGGGGDPPAAGAGVQGTQVSALLRKAAVSLGMRGVLEAPLSHYDAAAAGVTRAFVGWLGPEGGDLVGAWAHEQWLGVAATLSTVWLLTLLVTATTSASTVWSLLILLVAAAAGVAGGGAIVWGALTPRLASATAEAARLRDTLRSRRGRRDGRGGVRLTSFAKRNALGLDTGGGDKPARMVASPASPDPQHGRSASGASGAASVGFGDAASAAGPPRGGMLRQRRGGRVSMAASSVL